MTFFRLNRLKNSFLSTFNHPSQYNSLSLQQCRTFATMQQTSKTEYASASNLAYLRNIGISAHIDSGKTTTTERILYYTGRIKEMHEVKGKDGVGAKMDSMELEREKGITIKSAATHTEWGEHHINIIDTPGHVDFTIEVERSLQVLDGAIMIVCGVSSVQSQTITVDRQMKRYEVPRIIFINKCDRLGARPYQAVDDIRNDLDINAALIQIPIGLEEEHSGIIDLLKEKAYYFDGKNGENIREDNIPSEYKTNVQKYRMKLLEYLGEIDDEIASYYLEEKFPPIDELKKKIRKYTIERKFVPIFVGSAYKNKGVQLLLDGVIDYLPSPVDIKHHAFIPHVKDPKNKNKEKEKEEEEKKNVELEKVLLTSNKKDPLLFYAFKLEENQYGQLTWVRVYQGTLKKGISIVPNNTVGNVNEKKKPTRLTRIVRLHSNEIQDINVAYAGDICAMFGVDCPSGVTFSDGSVPYIMSQLHIPNTVVSLAVKPKDKQDILQFTKAYERFQREDPTFKVHTDKQTGECIFSGMGELQLSIYIERIQREYNVVCEVGKPKVNYKESITRKCNFDYLHKKQSGGRGQYARIIGYFEPIEGVPNPKKKYEFVAQLKGNNIPPQFVKSVDLGLSELLEKGPLIGGTIEGVKCVLLDGLTHEVDSDDLSFRLAAQGAFRTSLKELGAKISEPWMTIEIAIPQEYYSTVVGDLSSRGATINNTIYSGKTTVIKVYNSLDKMFGYATDLRSLTKGKGEFSMEYCDHQFVSPDFQDKLIQEYLKLKATNNDD